MNGWNCWIDNWMGEWRIEYKGQTIRKLIGGEADEVQKKIFAQGKIKWKKIHAGQLTLKNIYATA